MEFLILKVLVLCEVNIVTVVIVQLSFSVMTQSSQINYPPGPWLW